MVQYKAFKGMYYIFLFYCLKKKSQIATQWLELSNDLSSVD